LKYRVPQNTISNKQRGTSKGDCFSLEGKGGVLAKLYYTPQDLLLVLLFLTGGLLYLTIGRPYFLALR